VLFADDPGTGIPPAGQPWKGSRVLYMMHPSDPVVWWSPHLIFSKPDWLSEPRGKDLLKGMVWMPFVTFWQVSADLLFSTSVPDGHGHKYTTEYVDGWNAVVSPPALPPRTWPTSGRSSRPGGELRVQQAIRGRQAASSGFPELAAEALRELPIRLIRIRSRPGPYGTALPRTI
jgi:hypothetical protein